ncbi:MAG: PSD1 and planctomycete cytochrome C domain-containing protein [Deltaproteobacteria bacterium]|nr:PSD1 and planctomycete cytochrome C domain-containing protein [Deltaproteobacteria bacterium]
MFGSNILLPCLLTIAANTAPLPKVQATALDLLEKHCVRCHGPEKGSGGLRLTTRESAVKGGAEGPVLKDGDGDATKSLLLRAIGYGDPELEMPPASKLNAGDIAIIETWVKNGAPWPKSRRLGSGTWWAFREVKRPAVPEGTASSPIDRFVDQTLRDQKLSPVAEASKATLCRRVTLNLTGLPPTWSEIQAFVSDADPGAYERLVDRLLASPRYGEKWGRHFLDVIRYSDSTGFEQDPFHLDAWRFRDYIIKSFNDDKPYDRLVREMLASDELSPDDPAARVGTGFLRVGPNRDFLNRNEEVNRVEKLTDFVETTSAVFLGLTVGCARCHDHKFDPIPTRDFYRLQAIFEPAVYDNIVVNYEANKGWERSQNTREFKLRQLAKPLSDIYDRVRKKYPKENVLQLRKYLSAKEREDVARLEQTIAMLFLNYGPPPTAPGVTDAAPVAPKSFVAVRGNAKIQGERVNPGFLTVLGGGDIPDAGPDSRTTGRRKALAQWMTRPQNPLFARVMVNRLWQWVFGRGLIATANDFGLRAGLPSHQLLLDWLSAEFVERGFSMKAITRLMVTSAAYRRSSQPNRGANDLDPENLHLAHFSRRRLLAEEVRDSVLLSSGALNPKMGGMPVVPPLSPSELFGIQGRPEDSWPVTPDPEEYARRSVYLLNLRTFRPPMFDAFDAPDGLASCPRRHESTTAPQSLTLLNSDFMVDEAARLARKTRSSEGVFTSVLTRLPRAEEKKRTDDFVRRQTQALGSRERALAELARALLNTNEYLYVD